MAFASFLSLSTRAATSSTMMPALRCVGASIPTIFTSGVTVTGATLNASAVAVTATSLNVGVGNATISNAERDRAVDDFIDLVGVVDGILQVQSGADARYFAATCGRRVEADEAIGIDGDRLVDGFAELELSSCGDGLVIFPFDRDLGIELEPHVCG